MKQDLLGLKELSADQIIHILDTAASMKELGKRRDLDRYSGDNKRDGDGHTCHAS